MPRVSSSRRPIKRDIARTQAEILRVATEHFTRSGYFGARVDEIAAETATTKRMIYYCFGSKDGLFTAALLATYEAIRDFEVDLDLDSLEPDEAVTRYVAETLRYHEAHPELALLARAENLVDASHMTDPAWKANRPIVAILDRVLERGRAVGLFRAGVSGIEVHIVISALANFRITNQATVRALFDFDMRDRDRLDEDIAQYVSLVLGWLRREGGPVVGGEGEVRSSVG